MRATNAAASRKRRKRMIEAAKGFRLRRSKLYRYAKDAIEHGRQYAYRDRKNKKRTFRALWNLRINAAARDTGITYSRFIEGLKAAKVEVNRKVLADLAATDSAAFGELVNTAKSALEAKGCTLSQVDFISGRSLMAALFVCNPRKPDDVIPGRNLSAEGSRPSSTRSC